MDPSAVVVLDAGAFPPLADSLVAGAAARCGDVAQAASWAKAVHMHNAMCLSERVGRVGFIARELWEEAAAALEDG